MMVLIWCFIIIIFIIFYCRFNYVSLYFKGDIDDEEELLDWLTDPANMELTEHIERVNVKMFKKIRQTSDYVAVFFCEY